MIVRNARREDVAMVARLHIQAFPGFFLTSMGYSFLCELYQGFLSQSAGIFLVAEEEGNLIGFATGAVAPEQFFADLRKRRALWFLWHALPALLRRPSLVLRKLYSALFYRGDKPTQLEGGALLSSIGVKPSDVGKFSGSVLLQTFEDAVWSQGALFVYLTTDQQDNERANRFYIRNGYRIESQFRSGKRPMFRYLKERPSTLQ